ncbi:bacillithiol biosynthesis cysteine-adding enzyme BshC [Neolewinella lacunae]|uniref:Putative cysteine ligase BshC n=1 Tax=Neolewinella lacunae TaxID=1517758 RepID=A0A923T6Q4_9BACT|nr:bacillithiol biosynthesis cysteine-adding enzyme BshC [Neolewinella lacunae]MBC6993670.1 bacillithiol biosynthesis cysteine-adding enzyme BshC [Neolewinella lacunae]MDN3636365.1 bacillithiol biosynthesis cysteine-adding enzyme BshC [Neolewinella lacunae]
MQIDHIPFQEVPQFSANDVAYATGDPALRPFFRYPVSLESFADVMADKAKDATDRALLVRELLDQYAGLPNADLARTQVQSLLNGNAWTVITAHQPALFTGPLYFIYKICSTINLARQLNERYPDHHVVPVFITGGEDHDFEEINHARINGQRITWENDEGGAVGAMSTATLGPVLATLREILGGDVTPWDIYQRFHRAYTGYATYGEATVAFVHDLFSGTGLVVADPSRPALKAAFRPIMEREIFEQVSQPLIEKTQAALAEAGFSGQAHARDINLFYLSPGRRDRIVQDGEQYQILNTELVFSREALRQELHDHPERFSPNVVMRPLFQEFTFPNLAYVGGGGEIAYWLERKEQFAVFGLNFPMLIRRNSVLWIDQKSQKKIAKLGLDYRQLFRATDLIIRDYVAEQSTNQLSLAPELAQLHDLYNSIAAKAKAVDPTLEGAALADATRQAKVIENFEGRLRRIEKQRFDQAIEQIRALREKLFPNNSLQERTDNFLNLYLEVGEPLFDTLIEALNPLQEGMVVIMSE